MHARSLAKFGQIQDTIFILDGDQRDGKIEQRIRDAAERSVDILFLPGKAVPESWVWETLRNIPELDAAQLGTNPADLSDLMSRLDAIYSSASDSLSEIAKNKFRSLSEELRRDTSEICRIIARLEADRTESDIQPLVGDLRGILRQWRG